MEKKRCYGCMRLKTSTPFCEHCGHDERNQNAPHQLPAGTVLREQYLVGKVLGQGGFGITYLGWDLYLDIPVAIKEYYPTGVVMREASQTFSVVNCLDDDGGRFHNNRDRFMREAKMLARFAYVPEIVQIKNFFLANNTAYIVMEYVQGITLKEYIRRRGGSLSVQETFSILRPIMVGLSKIHKAGLIHRDISPDNIMMLPGGGAKLLDFGAVRDVGAATVSHDVSRSTDAILKQGYAPIEQYQQKGALGSWSDVYALCATIYYCLTGTVPPDAPARMLEEEKLTFDPRIGLDKRQMKALARGMALRAADRPRNMEELHQELFGMAIPVEDDAPRPEQPPEEPQTPVTPPKKKSKRWLLPVAVLLAALGIGAWLLRPQEARLSDRISATETTEQTRLAETEAETEPPKQTVPEEPTQPGRVAITDPLANTLMEHDLEDSDTGAATPAFGTAVTREQVQSITVLYTTQDAPATAVDASFSGNGKVLAWTEKQGELYDLYLAAEGGIYAPDNSEFLFACFPNVTVIDFNDAFFTDNVQSAVAMFYQDTKLTAVDVSGFNTANMTNTGWMFGNCENLKTLDVSGFDTGKVTGMEAMFQSCKSLEALDVSGFDTSNVTTMSYLFTQCSALKELDVSNFRTGKVTGMRYMFNECCGLTELDVSGFDTGNVTDMRAMFQDCTGLAALDVGGFNTALVTDMGRMFKGCGTLTTLDVSGFNTAFVTDMGYLFHGCTALTKLDVSGFDTSNVANMGSMFSQCGELSSLDVSGFRTEKVTDMSFMFSKCAGLLRLDVSGFDTSSATTMESMFQTCSRVSSLAVDGFDTTLVTDTSYMFNGCHVLTSLNLANWNTGNVTDMTAMFRECLSLTKLDISGFDTANVTSMARLFDDCVNLQELNIKGLETGNVNDMEYMFSNCSGLTRLSLTGFDTGKVTDMHNMFYGCGNLTSLDISAFDTSKVNSMKYMLYGCGSLTDLKLGTFDTSRVTDYENFMEPGKQVNGKDWQELFR